ncbi:hypothetical protein DSM112329_04296 [Paraconexibacter sp. AEG42_29]|uniref:VOC domain-containing protein n=1 Tax=Paraconexibacter sp. AEG42_29 TaxID=2997339 RepID=A0AAU7B1G1_9ACTN
MTTHALYPVTMSEDPEVTAEFYCELLALERTFTADWYVSLAAPGGGPQLATVARTHASIPDGFAAAPMGALVTVEVEDVDAVHRRAEAMGLPIARSLRDEDWGQRHFITSDPDGLLVDVVQVIAASPEYAAQYTDAARPV